MQGREGGGTVGSEPDDDFMAGKIGIREDEPELFCEASKVSVTVLFYYAVAVYAQLRRDQEDGTAVDRSELGQLPGSL